MEIDFSDIENKTAAKRRYVTLGLLESDFEEVQRLKAVLGNRNVAEIMRRAIRIGIVQAADKYGPKAG